MHPAELPTFEAQWWPVMLETIPGSGERIAISIVAQAKSGQSQIRQLISPATIGSLFTEAAAGMRLIIAQTTIEMQRQLDEGVRVDDLAAPFDGVGLGAARECLARDFNQVFEIAFRFGGAFGQSQFGDPPKSSDETRIAFDEWAEKIRIELMNAGLDKLRDAFNFNIKLAPNKTGRIGFLHSGYAANFGVLRPGRSASSDVRALKVKMFDLEALRHGLPLLATRAEIIVGFPEIPADGPYSRRELETQLDSWRFVESEARQREMRAFRYSVARDAASHLSRAIA